MLVNNNPPANNNVQISFSVFAYTKHPGIYILSWIELHLKEESGQQCLGGAFHTIISFVSVRASSSEGPVSTVYTFICS